MLGSVERKWRTGEKTPCPVEGITEWMNRRTPFPGKRDTAHPGTDQTQRADPRKRSAFRDGTAAPSPSGRRRKRTVRRRNREDGTGGHGPRRDSPRGFNSVRLVRQDERVIRAFVHSTQTVMVGATLKMQLAENCLTDDGQRIRKGTPVFGEVTGIDGERCWSKSPR